MLGSKRICSHRPPPPPPRPPARHCAPRGPCPRPALSLVSCFPSSGSCLVLTPQPQRLSSLSRFPSCLCPPPARSHHLWTHYLFIFLFLASLVFSLPPLCFTLSLSFLFFLFSLLLLLNLCCLRLSRHPACPISLPTACPHSRHSMTSSPRSALLPFMSHSSCCVLPSCGGQDWRA